MFLRNTSLLLRAFLERAQDEFIRAPKLATAVRGMEKQHTYNNLDPGSKEKLQVASQQVVTTGLSAWQEQLGLSLYTYAKIFY